MKPGVVLFLLSMILGNLFSSTLIEAHQPIKPEILLTLANADLPNAQGALSRNKKSYFSVRFQLGAFTLMTYGLLSKNLPYVEKSLVALEYAFIYQLPQGGFQVVVPVALSGGKAPSEVDVASAEAFFLASCTLTTLLAQESRWFQEATETAQVRQRLTALYPKLNLALDHFLTVKQIVEKGDAHAPNRLFFDALAFYGLGKILDRKAGLEAGKALAQKALDLLHPDGYFLEGEGYDSSYNAVHIQNAARLFFIFDPSDGFSKVLASAVTKSLIWQASRILPSGEVSTEGNSRVRPGGESFLGKEKSVNAIEVFYAFQYGAVITANRTYQETGEKILSFYYKKEIK